jgi:hypothetical protein
MTHASPCYRLANISAVALMLTMLSAPAIAQEKKFKAVSVKTPDGLTISAQDWGKSERTGNPFHPWFLSEPLVVDQASHQ